MGTLRDFQFETYGCNVYVETGTGHCGTLSKAIPHFSKCFTVDLDPQMVQGARTRFPSAIVAQGLSIEALEYWLQNDLAQEDRVFFFLDAHFPDSDYHGEKYDVAKPNAVPLEEELRLIQKYRANCKDYIVCDDARIYTIGNFEAGNVEWLQVPGGYKFVYDLFPDAQISLTSQEEGYIIIDKR